MALTQEPVRRVQTEGGWGWHHLEDFFTHMPGACTGKPPLAGLEQPEFPGQLSGSP